MSTTDTSTFSDLGLRPELLHALADLGYEEPTPIQRETVGPLLEGRDLLGQAATGTGKTAAFTLPLLQRTMPEHGRRTAPHPLALVLVPTRELAMQVSEAVRRYGQALGARVLAVYGGQPIVPQLKALQRGVDVVVGTPGRVMDHIARGSLKLRELDVVVLDEADEMLDMGFAEDIESILTGTPETRQTVLFSATMPGRIDAMARRHLREPVRVTIAREATPAGESPRVRQTAYVVARAHKPAALARVLDLEEPTAAIVFCRTRAEVDAVTETMSRRGHRAEALHGGMSQEQRSRVIERLKGGSTELVVATDVAARGLDIDQLSHVINYDVPAAPEAYVHRIGRVGRAGREGVALTFAQPHEQRALKAIERLTRQRIPVAPVPSVADLRARRLQATRDALVASIAGDDLAALRAVVEELGVEHDLVDVAAAALKLAQDVGGTLAADEPDIPAAVLKGGPGGGAKGGFRGGYQGASRGGGKGGSHGGGGHKGAARAGGPGGFHAGGGADAGAGRRDRGAARGGHGAAAAGGPTTRLFVGAGRSAQIRAQDLVGAITGESSLEGRDIGTIRIHDRFSLVEVPEAAADHVVAALRGTQLKGRKPVVRREGAGRAGR